MKQMGRPVVNKYKVPKKQWDRWSSDAKRVFNALYHSMRPSMQFVFIHPEARAYPQKHWDTTRWNAAWEAACLVDRQSYVASWLACAANHKATV
jgi:hypothetical protein